VSYYDTKWIDPRGSLILTANVQDIRKCNELLRRLVLLDKSEAGAVIATRALECRTAGPSSIKCWSQLFHTTKRIMAYPQSVQFILLAKRNWPALFMSPEVFFVQSSDPIPKPVRRKSQTADSIVGRMTRKEKEIKIFRDFVRSLQIFNLDERIQTEYSKDTFNPIVHCEVLLLNWLETHGGITRSRFFNDWMYIGSSKPMCKLCSYYFEEHRSGVEHRLCHDNLYTSWRVPDVLPSQGPAALEARQIMVDRVLLRVRKYAFDIVRKKVQPSYKSDDSNTFSARVTLEGRWTLKTASTDVDDIETILSGMEINEIR